MLRVLQAGVEFGVAIAYNLNEMRHREMKIAERAEKSREHFIAAWRSHPPKKSGCAAASNWKGLNGLPGGASSQHATLREVDSNMKE